MATILVRDVELFFRAKLEAQLGGDHQLVTAGNVDLAFVDIGRVDLATVLEELAGTPTIAFTNHTNTDGLRAAHEAGFDRVVIRSVISERAGKLVDELLGTTAALGE